MKRIYFHSEKELIYFCELIFENLNAINVEWKRSSHWGNELTLYAHDLDKDIIISCFKELFIQMRLHALLQEVLEKVYHYTDDMEINHVITLTKNMMMELVSDNGFTELMTYLFRRYLWGEEIIHYDAMILFSHKALTNSLEELVGRGIDEAKLEEAHQHFITSARLFLESRVTSTQSLYIVQGDTFAFYKKNGKKYTDLELRTAMLETPLYVIGLDEKEWNLAPVIALHPREIYVYGDSPSEAKTVALMNVFEEKMRFFPIDQFPFYHTK